MDFFGLRGFSTAAVAALVMFASGCATTTVQQSTPAATPYRSPLAGNEIVERLKGGANQAELSKEVQARGVVNVSAADFDALKSAGASPELQNAVLGSLHKANPAPAQTTTYVYRDYWGAAIPWWWAPHFGFGWNWHYRRR